MVKSLLRKTDLNANEKLQLVLDESIHLLLVGETNSGKTVAAKAILSYRKNELIYVLDPHATPTNWNGIRAIGLGRNYNEISQVMESLLTVLERRYKLLATGKQTVFQPITIVCDEMPSIAHNCGKTSQLFFGTLAREARKVNMRLIILTQSTRVRTIGIEREGDILENLTWIYLGNKARKYIPSNVPEIDYPLAIQSEGTIEIFSCKHFLALSTNWSIKATKQITKLENNTFLYNLVCLVMLFVLLSIYWSIK